MGQTGGVDRRATSEFLRSARQRLSPADVGYLPGSRRRIQGLRREEVAQLAGISVDYYTRLEQGRGPHPSPQVLSALATALRLTEEETDYLLRVGGQFPAHRSAIGDAPPGLLLVLLERLGDLAALVVNHRSDVLAWTDRHAALFGDPCEFPEEERNVAWMFFSSERVRSRFPEEDHLRLAAAHVAHLRAITARFPSDVALKGLIDRLQRESALFRSQWARLDVAVRRQSTKRVLTETGSILILDCDVLTTDDEHRLIVHRERGDLEA